MRRLLQLGKHFRSFGAAAPLCIAGLAAKQSFGDVALRPFMCQSGSGKTHEDKSLWFDGSSIGNEQVLASNYDVYSGVFIDPAAIPSDPSSFRAALQSSLSEWTSMKKHGVWLKLSIENADLIPIATSEFGFDFHNAESGHVMLTKWLPMDTPNTLPRNASHTVGVGAVVTNSEGHVLLVREKTGPASRLGIWKLPTGLVDAGEDLQAAAIREVKEETGVDSTFSFMGAYTMNHGGNPAHPNKSNLYFVVKLHATSSNIQVQESEIAEAKWFTQDEWRETTLPYKDSIWVALNYSALEGSGRIEAKYMPLGFGRERHQCFYYPTSNPPAA